MRKKLRPTIEDVAKLAGVTKGSVSKVLNNSAKISDHIKQRVQEAADKLNYRPNRVAQSLKNKKTKSIGLILPSVTDPFFAEVVRGAQTIITEKDYMLVLCSSEENIQTELSYVQMLEDICIDGIIFSGIKGTKDEDKQIKILYQREIPIVLVDREIEDGFSNVVMIDDRQAALKAAKYCLEMGHRRIGFIAAPLNIKIFQERLEGYKKALQSFELEINQKLIQRGDLSAQSGKQAAKVLLNCKPCPTAIFASTDIMAIGALKEIQENGLNVPEDISLIGFDDIPLASLVTPSLTTVHAPSYEMGKEAARLLIRHIEGENVPQTKVILNTKLIVRKSVARVHSM